MLNENRDPNGLEMEMSKKRKWSPDLSLCTQSCPYILTIQQLSVGTISTRSDLTASLIQDGYLKDAMY